MCIYSTLEQRDTKLIQKIKVSIQTEIWSLD